MRLGNAWSPFPHQAGPQTGAGSLTSLFRRLPVSFRSGRFSSTLNDQRTNKLYPFCNRHQGQHDKLVPEA